jgi:hypothetical protein
MIVLPVCVLLSLLNVPNHAGKRKVLTAIKYMAMMTLAPTVNFLKESKGVRHYNSYLIKPMKGGLRL